MTLVGPAAAAQGGLLLLEKVQVVDLVLSCGSRG